MTSTAKSELCDETLEHLAEVLDGSASERLRDHVTECDTCRDARHDAEEARRVAIEAGGDYRSASDLDVRVLAALDARAAEAPAEARATAAAPRAAPAAVTTTTQERREKSQPARVTPKRGPGRVAGAVVGVALAAAAVAFMASGNHPSPRADAGAGAWTGHVERVVSARGEGRVLVCDATGAHCTPAGTGTKLTSGSRLKTDTATRAELVLSDGSRVTLDRATELTLLAGNSRRARLEAGALVADVTHQSDEARFEVPAGAVTVHGTKFALYASERSASVDVSRGSVTLADARARSVRVVEGETGRLEPNAEPSVGFSSALGDSLGWSDETFGEDARALSTRGLGELRAKKPGQDSERAGAVTLASHQVRVRIAGVVARTEIEEVFENHTDDVLEGIYRFPLPPGAQIERLALDVDGKLEDGAFVDRERAAAIFRGAIVNAAPKQPKPVDEIVWVPGPWRDPA
ncbi:MAG TPA: FecR domain-containing protein, partial [Polyangiaceae bacterium]|nr:FecR domain-containing protein [Polyangiaceae bacterium]